MIQPPTLAAVRIQVGGLPRLLASLETARFETCLTEVPEGDRWRSSTWRYPVPPPEVWRGVLRAVRPGGYLMAIGSSRTVHRLTTSIEDAGWEVQDQITWLRDSWAPSRSGLRGLWEPIVLARHRGQSFPGEGPDWALDYRPGRRPKYALSDVVGRPPATVIMPGDKASEMGLDGLSFKAGDQDEVLRWAVQSFSPRYGDVLDPFCRFGSTGAAAIGLGRGWHGLETDWGAARKAVKHIRQAIRDHQWEATI